VPGCTGIVFDGITSENPGQCGNRNPSLSCCLPKTSCTNLVRKDGDTTWSSAPPPWSNPNTCLLYSLAPAVEIFQPGTGVRSGVKGRWSIIPDGGLRHNRRSENEHDTDPAAAFSDPAAATQDYALIGISEGGGSCTGGASGCSVSVSVEDTVEAVFSNFANNGGHLLVSPSSSFSSPAASPSLPPSVGAHGAISVSVDALAPGETRTLTIIFAWHNVSDLSGWDLNPPPLNVRSPFFSIENIPYPLLSPSARVKSPFTCT